MTKIARLTLLLIVCGSVALWGQAGGSGGGGGEGGGGGGESSAPSSNPTDRQEEQNPLDQPIIYLTGNVVLEDGTPPPERVIIERVCDGRGLPEGNTDSQGYFGFHLGGNNWLGIMDASIGSPDANSAFGPGSRVGSEIGLGRVDLTGCELRAVLSGYISNSIQLWTRSVFDDPRIGTLVLRRVDGVTGEREPVTAANAENNSISSTSRDASRKARQQFNNALQELRTGTPNFGEATKQLEKAVQEYPEFAEAWFLMGQVRLRMEDDAGAREAFEKAIEADADYFNPYVPLIGMSLDEDRWEDLEKLARQALRISPRLTKLQYVHAVASFNLGNLEAAEKSALAVRDAPEGESVGDNRRLLGMILTERGQYAAAAEQFSAYLASYSDTPIATDLLVRDPALAEVWFWVGRARLGLEDNAGARAAFEKAVEADAEHVKAYDPLVRMSLNEGRWEDASKLATQALQLDQGQTELQYFHAIASFESGNLEAAEKSALAVRDAPDGESFRDNHRLLGMILAERGEYAAAAEQLGAYLASDSGTPAAELPPQESRKFAQAWSLMGRVRLEEEDGAGAREAFEKAIEADAAYLDPYDPLIRMSLNESRWEDAEKLAGQALQVDPQLTGIQYFHAVASYELGNLETAEKWALAVRDAPEGEKIGDSYRLLGMILAEREQFDAAAEQFRAYVAEYPDTPNAELVRQQLTQWEALGLIQNAGVR